MYWPKYIFWTKKYEKAISVLNKTLISADEIQSKQLKSLTLKTLADNYEKLGENQKALDYFRQYVDIRDTLINEKDARHMAVLDAEFELKRQQDQINRLQRQNDKIRDRIFIYGLVAGVLFLMLVLWLVYLRFRSQRKTSELLEVKNNEIQRNNQQLSRANQDLINLTDLISNEVISPLHQISEQADNLTQIVDDGRDVEDVAKTIKDQAARIESMLTGFKLKAVEEEKVIQLEKIYLADIIRDATATLPEALKRQPIKIRFHELPEILANRRQMVKLFQYLLTNATRFRRDEDPTISISYTRQDGYFMIVFEDNSKGLPQTDQEANFCRIVAEAHGGKFISQSDFGKGNIFYIKIPE